jgi:hypothetical protein
MEMSCVFHGVETEYMRTYNSYLQFVFQPRRRGFNSRSIHVRFVVQKVAVKKVFLSVTRFPPISTTASMLHTHLQVNTKIIGRTSGQREGILNKELPCRKYGSLQRDVHLFWWSSHRNLWDTRNLDLQSISISSCSPSWCGCPAFLMWEQVRCAGQK